MKERIIKKLHTREGLTLAETLLALLILAMVTAVVATGVPSAKNAYEKVVLASNAEMLLSTTITSLRNELGTSQDIRTPAAAEDDEAKPGTIITYFNPGRGASSRIYVYSNGDADEDPGEDTGEQSDKPEEIEFQRYYSEDGLSASYPAAQMVSSTDDLYVTYTSVAYQDGIVTFSGLSVKRASGSELASRGTLSIRVISH